MSSISLDLLVVLASELSSDVDLSHLLLVNKAWAQIYSLEYFWRERLIQKYPYYLGSLSYHQVQTELEEIWNTTVDFDQKYFQLPKVSNDEVQRIYLIYPIPPFTLSKICRKCIPDIQINLFADRITLVINDRLTWTGLLPQIGPKELIGSGTRIFQIYARRNLEQVITQLTELGYYQVPSILYRSGLGHTREKVDIPKSWFGKSLFRLSLGLLT